MKLLIPSWLDTATNEIMKDSGYEQGLKFVENSMKRFFGSFESLIVNDTYQFDDYSKYVVTCFNEKKKAQIRKEQKKDSFNSRYTVLKVIATSETST